jgi:hypothetical protein
MPENAKFWSRKKKADFDRIIEPWNLHELPLIFFAEKRYLLYTKQDKRAVGAG